ncbi:MAG: Fe(3+) ABC transporter substrate-binding protein [Nitrosomonas sp.]|uniref:Fe(3+) ABC transporter substrate-binding protein n=1 Tax=Nitrosomonas sp. TaxID=42353 RepID=UPI0025FE20A6|nr:Fe(3+) ABC transporter substrate-binding protein [Nitrosomonas sp.]MBE7527510.1 Fe(3+) ABC transporter substrate-binding protein [Burkholderiales bacterium]MCC6160732.1 Fe(3+) ABC transporter substrate-binding protein [Nitrosomonas sp.]
MSRSFISGLFSRWSSGLFLAGFLFVAPVSSQAEEIVVYSARIEQLIKPLFDAFTKETGITVKFTTDKEGALLTRLLAEGKRTPADVLITVDAGNLWDATRNNLLKPVTSPILEANIPANLRDPKGQWFGLTVRARTIVYNTSKVKPEELSTYEDLADPKWKNRLCLRSSKKVYNQSLVAMMIAELGETETERIVKGWVNNLATDPIADDTLALEYVAAGRCDVTLVNTYYYGRLMREHPALPLAIFWPNQATTGVHVNVSGAGVTRYSKHEAAAVRLLEFLSSEHAQKLFVELNMEYPANPQVKYGEPLTDWGNFKQDPKSIVKAGELQPEAVRLMDRAGYR